MKFGTETRETLLEAIKKTYSQYLALEKARDFKFGQLTLAQVLQNANEHGQLAPGQSFQITISVNGQPIQLQLSLESDNGQQQRIAILRAPQTDFSLTHLNVRATNDFDSNNPQDVAYIIDLLSLTPLTYDYQNGAVNYDKPALHTTINDQEMKLGGSDKYDLYNEHLNVLVTLYRYLQDGDLQNLQTTLAKKAQGSGKTYLQALWFLVLNQAKLSAVFALPDNLTKQFLKDFKKLLPTELVDNVQVIEKNANDCAQAIDELDKLSNSDQAAYFIGSYKTLLDQHYDKLHRCSGDKVLMSFDEQHKVVKQERRKLRMQALSQKLWTMYLSATPDEKTSEDCQVIATMSHQAKKDAGQGDFSNVHVVRSKKMSDLRKKSDMRRKKGLVTKVANQFADEPTSAATSLITDLPFMVETKEIVQSPDKAQQDRWNKVPVMSRKALVCVGEKFDDLVNIDNFTHPERPSQFVAQKESDFQADLYDANTFVLTVSNDFDWRLRFVCSNKSIIKLAISDYPEIKEIVENILSENKNESNEYIFGAIARQLQEKFQLVSEEELLTKLYSEGNKRDRGAAYDLMLQDANVDKTIAKSFLEKKVEQYVQDHGDTLAVPRSLHDTLDNTIFHGVIENMLRAVLAFDIQDPQQSIHRFKSIDTIKMNQMRINDLRGFVAQVNSKMTAMHDANVDLTDYFTQMLQHDKKNNPRGIDPGGAREVAQIMRELINKISNDVGVDLTTVVDNNGADYSLLDKIYKRRDLMPYKNFKKFAQKFRTLYMIKGMTKAEVSIDADRPFNGFTEVSYSMFEKDGTMSVDAKKRKHSAIETLDDNTAEYRHTPNYMDFNEEIADNYFMLGLVGMYVSDAKSTGFSDANLQTTIQLVPDSGDNNNRAPEILQTMTRNRGLDPTQIPSFVQLLDADVDVYFDAKLPQQKEHYDRDYYRAEKRYRVKFQEKLAKQVAKDVRDWLYDNLDIYDQVDKELFALQVDKVIAKNLRKLNNNNGHDISLSKKEYYKVLKLFQKELSAEIENTEKPYELKFFVRFVAGILNTLSRLFRFFSNIVTRFRLARARRILRKKNPDNPDVQRQLLYSKILNTHSLQEMMRQAFVAKEFKQLFDREQVIIKSQFDKTKDGLMTSQDRQMIADYFITAVKMFYQPNDQALITEAVQDIHDWVSVLMQHESQLNTLQNIDDDHQKLDALKALVQSVVQTLVSDGNPMPAMQQHDEFINRGVAQFLKADVLPQLMLFLPAYSYHTVRDILFDAKYPHEGDNALRFARHLTDQQVDMSSPGTIMAEFGAFFQADYPQVVAIESQQKIEDEALRHLITIQNDVMAIFTSHIAVPKETNNKLISFLGKTKAAASYVVNRRRLTRSLSQYLQSEMLINAEYALPKQEYNVLVRILGKNEYADQFAGYLVARAPELQNLNQEQDSFSVLVGYLKECFQKESFSAVFDSFRDADGINAQAQVSMSNINNSAQINIEQHARAQIESLVHGQQQLGDLFGENNKFEQHAIKIAKIRLTNVLMHPQFVTLHKTLLNKLTQADIVGLLSAYEEGHPATEKINDKLTAAKQVLDFAALINKKDSTVLDQFDMTQFPVIQTALERIADQIVDWHCQFEQTNRRGEETVSKGPQDVNDIRTIMRYQNSDSLMSNMSRKLMYMQAIRDALPDASKVSAYTNRGRIALLLFMKTHLVDTVVKMWNKSKQYLARILKKTDAQLAKSVPATKENQCETSYRKHALTLTTQLREAQALQTDQVAMNAKEHKDAVAPTITGLDGLYASRMAKIASDSPLNAGQNLGQTESNSANINGFIL